MMKTWSMLAAVVLVAGTTACASKGEQVGSGTGEMTEGAGQAGGDHPSADGNDTPSPPVDERAPTARLTVDDLDGDGAPEEFVSFDPTGTGNGNVAWEIHLTTKVGASLGTINGLRVLPLEDGSADHPAMFFVYSRTNGATCRDHALTRYVFEDGHYQEKNRIACDDVLEKVKQSMEQDGASLEQAWIHVAEYEAICESVLPEPCRNPLQPPQ